MTYLLDLNAFVALGFINHEFHVRLARWVQSSSPQLTSCPITELGFVRVLAQAPAYGYCSPGTYTLAASQRGSYVCPHIHSRQSRCLASSCFGQNAKADHRWSFDQTRRHERCNPCNAGREYLGPNLLVFVHSSNACPIVVIGFRGWIYDARRTTYVLPK